MIASMGRGARHHTADTNTTGLDELLASVEPADHTLPYWARDDDPDWQRATDRQTYALVREASAVCAAAIDAFITERWQIVPSDGPSASQQEQYLRDLVARATAGYDHLLDATVARALCSKIEAIEGLRSQTAGTSSAAQERQHFERLLYEDARKKVKDEFVRKMIATMGKEVAAAWRRDRGGSGG